LIAVFTVVFTIHVFAAIVFIAVFVVVPINAVE